MLFFHHANNSNNFNENINNSSHNNQDNWNLQSITFNQFPLNFNILKTPK